jgi:hypothetical protein
MRQTEKYLVCIVGNAYNSIRRYSDVGLKKTNTKNVRVFVKTLTGNYGVL